MSLWFVFFIFIYLHSEMKQTIKSLSLDDRPREKLLGKGTQALSNAELLAILLGSGTTEMNALQLAQFILKDVDDNWNRLARKSIKELTKYPGIGPAKAVNIAATLEIGRRRSLEEGLKVSVIEDSHTAYQILSPLLSDLNVEEFWVLFLNQKNGLIHKQQMSIGGIAGTVVDVRVILKEALLHQATKIILAHNHPSGNLNPSKADISLTKKMIEAGKTMDIQVVDHLIITQEDYSSVFRYL